MFISAGRLGKELGKIQLAKSSVKPLGGHLLDNTDCAEIEVLLLFCDVIEPIGCFGDSSGWAGVGGL